LPDASALSSYPFRASDAGSCAAVAQVSSSTSLRSLLSVLHRRRRVFWSTLAGLLLLCLLYCLLAPNEFEARAKVALRDGPSSTVSLEGTESLVSASVLSSPVQLETVANGFRTDRLAWRVITELRLDQAAAFRGSLARRFPGFHIEPPAAGASPSAAVPVDAGTQAYLLERFSRRLLVVTLPRTLVIEIRFRSRDGALSAAVVNALIRAYGEQEKQARFEETARTSDWLAIQLKDLKASVDRNQQCLNDFQRTHGLLSTPEALSNGQPGDAEHAPALLEIDALGKALVEATTDRILREAEYRAASQGDPEQVVSSDSHPQTESGSYAQLAQIHKRRSELELELAQFSTEHGPNFPRVVEIRGQLKDLDRQKLVEDARLTDHFQAAWQTAVQREQMVRSSLDENILQGMKINDAATEYAAMRQEANSSQELYTRVKERVEEAGLSAGIRSSSITVLDEARVPVKPVAPDLPLYMAITLFVGFWLAGLAASLSESLRNPGPGAAAAILVLLLACAALQGQAPVPNTSGLPTGVVHIPQSQETRSTPSPNTAPAIWENAGTRTASASVAAPSGLPLPGPIGAGDSLEVSEYRTPEFHASVRVSASGTVMLPMINAVQVGGMDEQTAASAIEAALVINGYLLHPQVTVLITASAGQDVSVLGEVNHPGVYPFTVHHSLLDLISSASGLGPNAGRMVVIFHRADPATPHPVVLDVAGSGTSPGLNPELIAGDTVQVSRAGLVYVIGDVIRPGGFLVDPYQGLTVVQAVSLAWGPTQNAATGRAVLIREQRGGRTVTTLNLKRMLRGLDPDRPIQDRDILFVPDSMSKNLINRTMESAIQSAIGVTIYAGLVYSQRF